jgi:hypothetical protein
MAIRRPHHARRAQPPSGAPIDRLFVRTRFELTGQSRARTASLTLASAKRLTRERSRRLSLAAAQAERRQGRVPADAAPEGRLTDRIAGADAAIRAASIQATAAAGALAAGALAFIGAVRLARGGLAFSPCRAMGAWR